MDISAYNVVYTSQCNHSGDSMPFGGYDTGCNVWVENNIVYLYFQQNGGFDENNRLLKQGRLSLRFTPNIFADTFRQTLNLPDGSVFIESTYGNDSATIKLWASRTRSAVHIEFASTSPVHIKASYDSWRYKDRVVDSHDYELFGAKEVWGYPGTVTFHKDILLPKQDEVLFYHHNDNSDLSFDKEMDAQGLGKVKALMMNPQKDLITGGVILWGDMQYCGCTQEQYMSTPCMSYNYRTSAPVCSQNIYILLHTGRYATADSWEKHLRAKGTSTESHEDTAKEWEEYWNLSHIYIEDPSSELWQVGRNYQLFRYMQGCSHKSSLPSKFNGGLFTFDPEAVLLSGNHPNHIFPASDGSLEDSYYKYDPDYRRWSGGTYTTQNQRFLYWYMLKSGDHIFMETFFDFYMNLLPNAKLRTETLLYMHGAVFPEQLTSYGLCCTCDSGWDNTTGWPVEQIRYIFSNPLEIAWMILKYHHYSGRSIQRYMAFIEEVVEVYPAFYQELDESGKMRMSPANALESYHPVDNPADGIAALSGVLEALLELRDITSRQREYWSHLLTLVPPLPLGEVDGNKVFLPSLAPSPIHNVEIPQLYPVFPFERITLLSQGVKVAINTIHLTLEDDQQTGTSSWQHIGLQYARLGMIEEASRFLIHKMSDSGRRFPAFFGPGWDWTPDMNWLGSGSLQLQEMLMQTYQDKILLFPCWDINCDVDFKLFAPNNTVVEATLRNKVLVHLNITPPERRRDIINYLEENRHE